MRTLNLGIVAHVDAGKTSLTERLLHAAGVIDEIGRVDDGNTQTDTLALERQRGITIRSAVVSFVIDGVTVNLIDTPGHPDFIAEVDRVLSVLDGAVLVVSAVEGVQPQTRVLMRALGRLRIPTIIFVNKIDRMGARADTVLASIRERLAPSAVSMGTVSGLGTRGATFTPSTSDDERFAAALLDLLSRHDDTLLAAYVHDPTAISYKQLRATLAEQTRQVNVHPVFFGSAVTGAGVDAVMAGIAELLPGTASKVDGPVSGTVFKVERGPAGEKVAYVRVFSGTVRTRDRLPLPRDGDHKVTAISVFDDGTAVPCAEVSAGQIAKLWGLQQVQVGDTVGRPRTTTNHQQFAPPTFETAVVPVRANDGGALHQALTVLAEQDPLINLRQDERRGELYVSLYGEVQKEVIGATLAAEFGIDVAFRETTTVCVEWPAGTGEAVEFLQDEANPFRATIGLRIEPAPPGSGIEFRLDADRRTVPTHIFKNVRGFTDAMDEYVRQTLREGLRGWPVIDCTVTMTTCDYSVADGPPSRRGPDSTASDFRKLTPLVVMAALQRAGTVVCEPVHRFSLEIPAATLGAVLPVVTKLRGVPQAPAPRGSWYLVDGVIPASQVHRLQRELPSLTGGEGVLETALDHYQPVSSTPPTRPRTDLNPLNRKEYLLHVLRNVNAATWPSR